METHPPHDDDHHHLSYAASGRRRRRRRADYHQTACPPPLLYIFRSFVIALDSYLDIAIDCHESKLPYFIEWRSLAVVVAENNESSPV